MVGIKIIDVEEVDEEFVEEFIKDALNVEDEVRA